MSEPYTPHRWRCARCNQMEGACHCREPVPSAPSRALLSAYIELRGECIALEELIATGAFTEEEANRLDRGVTVMKVGFKLLKKVLRTRGVVGRIKPDSRSGAVAELDCLPAPERIIVQHGSIRDITWDEEHGWQGRTIHRKGSK